VYKHLVKTAEVISSELLYNISRKKELPQLEKNHKLKFFIYMRKKLQIYKLFAKGKRHEICEKIFKMV